MNIHFVVCCIVYFNFKSEKPKWFHFSPFYSIMFPPSEGDILFLSSPSITNVCICNSSNIFNLQLNALRSCVFLATAGKTTDGCDHSQYKEYKIWVLTEIFTIKFNIKEIYTFPDYTLLGKLICLVIFFLLVPGHANSKNYFSDRFFVQIRYGNSTPLSWH